MTVRADDLLLFYLIDTLPRPKVEGTSPRLFSFFASWIAFRLWSSWFFATLGDDLFFPPSLYQRHAFSFTQHD